MAEGKANCPSCQMFSEFTECYPYCEDCGDHSGLRCENCGQCFDHVWDSEEYNDIEDQFERNNGTKN